MVNKSTYKEANLGRLENFLSDIEVYPITLEVSKIYSEIKLSLINHFGPKNNDKRRKYKLEDIGFTENDIWIASVAKKYGLTLLSQDQDFERIKEVVSFDYERFTL